MLLTERPKTDDMFLEDITSTTPGIILVYTEGIPMNVNDEFEEVSSKKCVGYITYDANEGAWFLGKSIDTSLGDTSSASFMQLVRKLQNAVVGKTLQLTFDYIPLYGDVLQ